MGAGALALCLGHQLGEDLCALVSEKDGSTPLAKVGNRSGPGSGLLLIFLTWQLESLLPCEGAECDQLKGPRLQSLLPALPATIPYSSFSGLERLQSPQTPRYVPVMVFFKKHL